MAKKATAGERIASKEMRMVHTTDAGRAALARKIDAAIRRAVKEAWSSAQKARDDAFWGEWSGAKEQIEQKYRVKL